MQHFLSALAAYIPAKFVRESVRQHYRSPLWKGLHRIRRVFAFLLIILSASTWLYMHSSNLLLATSTSCNAGALPTSQGQNRHLLRVACFGFWPGGEDCTEFMLASILSDFLNIDLQLVDIYDRPDILFVSVFAGELEIKRVLRDSKSAFRISFSGENRDQTHFEDGLLDLFLGFRCPEGIHTPCLRFPLWLADATTSFCVLKDDFLLEDLTPDAWASRPCFASLVSSHGGYPREELFDAFSQVGFVAAPGAFIHNANFSTEGGGSTVNEKISFLSRCRYNICPENSQGDGYVTEKLFQAIVSGAVPVYWGESPPEPQVLNSQRILNLSPSDNVTLLMDRVERLEHDPVERAHFFASPVLVPGAQDYVSGICTSYVSHISKRFPRLDRLSKNN